MTLTFCLGFADQTDFIALFEKIWMKLIKKSKHFKKLKMIKPPFKLIATPEIPIGVALRSKNNRILLSESLGQISGDIICPYPPGIPLIVPGERIDQNRLKWIKNLSIYNEDLVNSYIRVLKS